MPDGLDLCAALLGIMWQVIFLERTFFRGSLMSQKCANQSESQLSLAQFSLPVYSTDIASRMTSSQSRNPNGRGKQL